MTLLNEAGQPAPKTAADDSPEVAFPLIQPDREDARIKVIGVGGGGGNATQRMADVEIDNVEFVCVNTDAQALRGMRVGHRVQIGRETTKGLGAGATPERGQAAAEESVDVLAGLVEDADMLFITAGMGGGTGTGAAPVIARLARERDVLTVAVVTRPFAFEGERRRRVAEEGIEALRAHVDSLITIPNDRLITEFGPDMSLEQGFAEADNVLYGAVRGISDLIVRPRHDQRRLRRRAHGDGAERAGDDGHRHRPRRDPRAGGDRAGHQLPAAGRVRDQRRPRHAGQRHHQPQPDHARVPAHRRAAAAAARGGCDAGDGAPPATTRSATRCR